LNRFKSKEDNIGQNIEQIRPVDESIPNIQTTPEVPSIADSIAITSSSSKTNNIINNVADTPFSSPTVTTAPPIPVFGGIPLIPPLSGGGEVSLNLPRQKKQRKKRATKSVFQSLFNVDTFTVKQNGKSEQTGLFLRN
jgi:hypothetical protein